MKRSFTVRDLPRAERPRERLQHLGAEALSVPELLALVLGRGIKGESVLITAQRLLSAFGGIKAIAEASGEELVTVRGIGPAKAAQLQAAFELARRCEETGVATKIIVDSAAVAARLARSKLKNKQKEHFWVIALDTRNNLIKTAEISVGSVNANLVHPREVFQAAIQALATHIIIAHNHPAGDPEPSADDLTMTKRLVKVGRTVGIEVIDNIIVAGEEFVSFKERGLV